MIEIDHIQLAIPKNSEEACRKFWCDILGFEELEKPQPLRDRGGLWLKQCQTEVHLGVDPHFQPATKAHPGFLIYDIDETANQLETAGYAVKWENDLPDRKRFFTKDPVGNRIEFLAFVDL